jgi:cell division protein FtsL
MVFCKKIIAVIVMVFTILFYQSSYINAQPAVAENNGKITQNKPEMMATPEETIPVETVEKKLGKWEWIILGTLAVGAIAAAGVAASGGGGGGDSQQPAATNDGKGNVEVTW